MIQTLWSQANLSQNDLRQLVRDSGAAGDGLGRVPLIVRTELLLPSATASTSCGRSTASRAAATPVSMMFLRTPPESTAQILHPDKYPNQVHAVGVSSPGLAAALGPELAAGGQWRPGRARVRDLARTVGHRPPLKPSAWPPGWSGDHWQLVENDGRSAIVLKSTWARPAAASESFQGVRSRPALSFRPPPPRSRRQHARRSPLPVAATDLRLQGSDVLIVIALDRDTANAVVAAVSASVPRMSISSGLHVTTSLG